MFSTAGLKSKDSIVRGAAIELFGLIASRLKQDAISCSNDSLWILAEVHSKPTGSSSGELRYAQSRMQGCAVCQAAGRGSKNMVSCAQCERLFHGDCIGIGGQTLISQGWLCCCCLCKKQLLSFAGDGKPSAVGDVIYQKHAINSDLVDGRTVLQQLLLNYLQEVAQSDNLAEFARGLVVVLCLHMETSVAFSCPFRVFYGIARYFVLFHACVVAQVLFVSVVPR